jgi:hypothetical protein
MAAIAAPSSIGSDSNSIDKHPAENATPVTPDLEKSDLELESPQAQFGDQSSRLPRRKIVTVRFWGFPFIYRPSYEHHIVIEEIVNREDVTGNHQVVGFHVED